MNELYERLLIGAEQIGNVVPALVGAAVIMLTGYFLARQVQRWADDTLKKRGLQPDGGGGRPG